MVFESLTPDVLEEESRRLEERIEAARYSNSERFIDVAEELGENFDGYGNDFYHGTWGQSAERIMDVGIRGNVGTSRLTGETGTQDEVSLTYLPAWAFHYSLDQDPNTVKTVTDFVNENYGLDIRDRDELAEFVESLNQPEEIESHAGAYNARILKEVKEDTQGFQDVPRDIPEDWIKVHEVVFGVDYDSIKDQASIENPPTRDEIEALNSEEYSSLGEVKITEVPNQDLTAYVPHLFIMITGRNMLITRWMSKATSR